MLTRDEILKTLKSEHVAYLRLWFSDIMGQNKNVEVPASQFEKALDGQILFDGSSIQGFSRIEESDMLLSPDYSTFRIFPWYEHGGKVAVIICDVCKPDGAPFIGCPRSILKKMCEKAEKMGYIMNAGPEAEFFLFEKDSDGKVTTKTNDAGSYFDLTPVDRAEDTRRMIVQALEQLGFEVEAAHHEVAVGQHEIDFKYSDALHTADNISIFRFVVRKVALDCGLHATFMPKPVYGISGSGMHTNQSLSTLDGENAFYDPNGKFELSEIALHYIGGLLTHVKGFCAITNPIVNSYKRLVSGFEAPTDIVWAVKNRSPLIRIPARRGSGTRAELRSPDPSCNPYLAMAAMLAAGLDGVEKQINPGEPVNRNIYKMNSDERKEHHIESLPIDLSEAIDYLEKDTLIRETLGDHVLDQYITAKRKEWFQYITQVHQWELDEFLSRY